MDQTPVFHAMDCQKTIDRVGSRTVNLHTSASDSKRVTVAVTVTASGQRVRQMGYNKAFKAKLRTELTLGYSIRTPISNRRHHSPRCIKLDRCCREEYHR